MVDDEFKYEREGTSEELKEAIEEEKKEEMRKTLRKVYDDIISVLKHYCDIEENFYKIISLWIIGTYFYKEFFAYPYLYINATKSSGKSRLLRLISKLCWNGRLIISISEAVLFRTAHKRTLCIDEFERIASKEKQALRELLNAAYKKGGIVERAYKIKGKKREKIEIETFNVYCPVAMANIYGIENVLADRCITLILEKSSDKRITKLIEDFDVNQKIKNLKKTLHDLKLSECRCSVVSPQEYNQYISYIYTTTLNTRSTLTTLTTLNNEEITLKNEEFKNLKSEKEKNLKKQEFIKKVMESNLDGRELELFFPLFNIAFNCGILDEIIGIAESITKWKKQEDVIENRDIALLDYIANHLPPTTEFIKIRDIYNALVEDQQDEREITPRWIGAALKRLKLIVEKRRMARGIEVKIDFNKAKRKIKIYKPEEEIEIEKVKDENEEEAQAEEIKVEE